jgi:hypothetical protein
MNLITPEIRRAAAQEACANVGFPTLFGKIGPDCGSLSCAIPGTGALLALFVSWPVTITGLKQHLHYS